MATILTETKMWLALKSRVESLPLEFPKAWPGETFAPPYANGLPSPYLRIGRVSAPPVRRMIADGRPYERTGALMVVLVHPLRNDVSVYDQMAAQIADHFNDATEMTYNGVCVSVTSYPHVQEGYEDTGYWNVPVMIPWRCFA